MSEVNHTGVKPTAGNILVQFIQKEQTYGAGPILRPKTFQHDYDRATVLDVGPEVREWNETVRTAPVFYDKEGERPIAPGDIVVVKKRFGEDRFEYEGPEGKREATFIKFADVRGVETE